MTIQSDDRKTSEVLTDGVTAIYDYDFPVFYGEDGGKGIEVRYVNNLGFDVVPQSSYLVLPNTENSGGSIQFQQAPILGKRLQIVGKTQVDQQLDITNHGRFQAEAIETNFDKIFAIMQEWYRSLDEEARQRISNDAQIVNQYVLDHQNIREYLEGRLNAKWAEINTFFDNLLPVFFCVMRKEINSFVYSDSSIAEIIKRIGSLIDTNWTADFIVVAGGGTQQDVNDRIGNTWRNKVGGYGLNDRVMLENGDIVKNTVLNSTNDPNLDMTGWTPDDGNKALTKLNTQFVSVWDFFTYEELGAYTASPRNFDSHRPVQAFFDAISSKDYVSAYCSGDFMIGSGLSLGGQQACLTKTVFGSLKLTALNSIDTMLEIQAGGDFKWFGNIATVGTGGASFSSRTCRVGMRFGGQYLSSRNVYTALNASNFSQVGISCNDLTTLTNFGDVRATNCGSGVNLPNYSLVASYSNIQQVGSANSNNQRSNLDVSVLPPEKMETDCFIIIDNSIHYIYDIDRQAGKLSVFPWISGNADVSGTLCYLFGAGAYEFGADASVLRFQKIDAKRCSIGYWSGALYAAVADNVVTQYCGVGLAIGLYPKAAQVGGQINGFYCENNNFDILRVAGGALSRSITSQYALNFDKIAYCNAARPNNISSPMAANLTGVNIFVGGNYLSLEGYSDNRYASTIALDVTSTNRATRTTIANTKNYSISAPSNGLNRAFGFEYTRVVQFSPSPINNYAPISATFIAPDGYTVNELPSVSFSDFSAAAVFNIVLNFAEKNFIISCETLKSTQVTSSVEYDPPPLSAAGTAGDTVTTTVTLSGAVVGNVVQAAFSQYNANIEINAQVSSANTITVKFKNTSAAAVDLPSGTIKAKII